MIEWYINAPWYLEILVGWLLIGFVQWLFMLPELFEFGFINILFWLVPYTLLGPFAFVTRFIGIL